MTQLRHTREAKKPSILAYVTAFPTVDGWRRSRSLVEFWDGAQRRALELGYTLEEWWVRQPGMTERRFCEILRTRGIHGMIVAPLPYDADPLHLEWSGFATAAIAYSLSTPNLNRASNDHFGSMNVALNELTALGYRRIGLAIVEESDPRVRQHWTAGMLAYQQHVPMAERVPTFLGSGPIARPFANWFHEHQPHAVLSPRGEVLQAIRDLGFRVPQDVGFSNLAISPGEDEMAGVNQNSDLVGVAAVDLVDGQLRRNEWGVPRHPRTLLIPGEWVPGATVRDLRATPRRVRARVS